MASGHLESSVKPACRRAIRTSRGRSRVLKRAGAVAVEKASGVGERPELDSLVADLAAGDSLVVTEVSRPGRSTTSVLFLAEQLAGRGIHPRIVNLGIETARRQAA